MDTEFIFMHSVAYFYKTLHLFDISIFSHLVVLNTKGSRSIYMADY
jgi:hypothetical protein